jgi:hypothetical protein
MKRIFVFTRDPYVFYVKIIVNNEITIQARSDIDFLKILKNIVVGDYDKQNKTQKVSLKTIFEKGFGVNSEKNKFAVKDVRFYSKGDSEILNLFQGFPYDVIEYKDINTNASNLISPFLDHVFNVICDKNNDLFNYIISWISYLIQNPSYKTETALILIGEQGTGKNKFFTDVLSKLFGRYAIPNKNNINNIIGRFNSSIENKILVVCNELQSIDNAKHLNTDGLKSLISDRKCNVESKYLNL